MSAEAATRSNKIFQLVHKWIIRNKRPGFYLRKYSTAQSNSGSICNAWHVVIALKLIELMTTFFTLQAKHVQGVIEMHPECDRGAPETHLGCIRTLP